MSARSPFSRCRPKARRVSAPKPGPGSRGNKPCAFFPLMGKDAQPQGARRGRLSLLVQPYHRAEQRDRDRDKSDPAPRHEADIVDIMAVAAAPAGDFGPCAEDRRTNSTDKRRVGKDRD